MLFGQPRGEQFPGFVQCDRRNRVVRRIERDKDRYYVNSKPVCARDVQLSADSGWHIQPPLFPKVVLL